jgi:hypothetical protein
VKTNENHGTIAAWVAAQIDVKIGFPIVEGSNVASLIDQVVQSIADVDRQNGYPAA